MKESWRRTEPRAILAFESKRDCETLIETFAGLGIEAYSAEEVDWVAGMASRVDTLAVVFEDTPKRHAEVVELLRGIRKSPKSQGVLTAVVADPEVEEELYEAGAMVVKNRPLTPAAALKLIWRLARRPRLAELPAGGAEEPETLDLLRKLISRRQGRHKIFIGAAPGVGKTYAALGQAHELHGRGEDVVVGVVETHGRRETRLLAEGLQIIPRKEITYKGTTLKEMDLDAILARKPAVVLVDELAHTNAPGSLNLKRYEDVELIRMAGIQVVSTINIQHLESLNDVIERLTGVKVRETVPDWVLLEAAEVVLIDISPESLQQRLKEGKIYTPEKIDQSLSKFFTTHNLTALRELVLRELADRVDISLEAVRADIGRAAQATGIQDRILICIGDDPDEQRLIRRGARLADRLNAELLVAHVNANGHRASRALEQNLELAETLEAEVIQLDAPDVGTAIADLAMERQASIIMLGESHRSRVQALFRRPIVDTLLALTKDVDIVIVASNE